MPTEAPNTLRSRAKFNIVDIISQGPIKGLFNGAKSIYLDETPVQNEDGTYNFPNFDVSRDLQELPVTVPSGSKTPIYPGIFPSSENEVSVATKVTKNSPEGSGSGDGSVTRTITDSSLDALRITMRVLALTNTNTTTGDITGGTIRFNIYVKPNGGVFAPISAGSQWEGLPAYNSETDDGATGIEVTATYPGGVNSTAITGTFQYRKKTGGVWGDWITFGTATIPAKTPSSDKRGYYNDYMGAQTFTRSVTNLTPGIYQAQVVSNKGITGTSARQFIENALEIQGKTVSAYDASYLVNLPDGGAPWDVKVVRISDDNIAANIQDDLYWFSYTEIIDNRFSWPNINGIRLSVDAESFGGNVPNRSYDVMGLMIQVPSNYDSYNRTYTGVWNGTFKADWTDNPAWIFYDLLTNKRYGLGDNIDASQIDKYALYQIAQYCDELVDAPNGEQEPRYTCSCVINSQSEAYELLTAIASAFRGMIYHSGGMITPVADMPSDPVLNVGPANVIDGIFTYQGASRKARHTVARVSWNNPDDGYKLNVELYEDTEAIRKYGYRPIDINAFGCTSRGLARRWGKWAIVSDNDAPDTVTYKAGFAHFKLRPGDVINIADPNYSGEQLFGLIVSVTDNVSPATHTIKLDRAVTRVAGDTSELQLTLTDGSILALDVAVLANTTSDEITVDSAELTTIPLAGASWLLKKGTVEPRQWRVISISEDEPHIYQVTAMLYDPNKYDSIETGLNFAEADFTAFPSGPLAAPTSLAISEFLKQTGSAILECATFSWVRPADARAELFEMQYQEDGKDWQATTPNLTGVTSVDIINIVPGTYNFRVRAQDSSGIFRSEWATLASQTLQGKNKAPENVTGFTASVEKFGVLLSWNKVSDIDIDYYEIRTGASWAAGTPIAKVKATTFKYEDATTGAYTFWIKALDTQTPANESATAASTSVTVSAQAAPSVVATAVNGGIQLTISGVTSRGFLAYEIQRKEYPSGTETTINSNVLTKIFTDTNIATLTYTKSWQYRVRALDQNGSASAWSSLTSATTPKQIENNDITANQIIAKDFRTACNAGNGTVSGVLFNANGIQAWNGATNTFCINAATGDVGITGTITACAGVIGGFTVNPTEGLYAGTGATRVQMKPGAGFWAGATAQVDAPFSVTQAGVLKATSGTIGNWKIETNKISRCAADGSLFWIGNSNAGGNQAQIYIGTCSGSNGISIGENPFVGGSYGTNKIGINIRSNSTNIFTVCSDCSGGNLLAQIAGWNFNSSQIYSTGCGLILCNTGAIQTGLFQTGNQGWKIDSVGNAEFNNICARGAIRTAVFIKDQISVIGGCAMIRPAGIWDDSNALSATSASYWLKCTDEFAVNDLIRIKDGVNDYWGHVTRKGVTDGKPFITATFKSGVCNWIPTKGQAVVNYGSCLGCGGIMLNGQCPYIDLYTHAGLPWNGTESRVRIGNLKCWGTFATDTYGIAAGCPTGQYMTYDSVSGVLDIAGNINVKSTLPLSMPAGAVLEFSAKGATTATIALAGGVKDISGNSNHGQAFGGVTVVDSEVGKVFSFNGTDTRISTNILPSALAAGAFTIRFMIKTAEADRAVLIGNYGYSEVGESSFNLEILASGLLRFYGSWKTPTDQTVSATVFNTGEFIDLVFIYDGADKFLVYKNGVLDKETTATIIGTPHATPLQLGIDARTGATAFGGLMAHPKIYNRALTAAEVKTLYMIGTNAESGVITADRVQTGVLSSLNWGTSAGSCISMNDGTFALGGSSAPKLSWNGTTLNVVGNITITGGSGISNFSDAGALATVDNLDGVADGSTYKRTTQNEKTGAGYGYNGLTTNGTVYGIARPDTRSTNQLPSWYARGVFSEFKNSSVIGITGANTYGNLTTDKPWNDASGGYVVQTYSDGSGVWERRSTADHSAWQAWYKVTDSTGSLVSRVVPAQNAAPSGSGLYLGSDYMGFHNGSVWKTYMDNTGNFYLGGSAAGCGLAWNATTNCLTVCGCITSCDGTIGGWTLTNYNMLFGIGSSIRLGYHYADCACFFGLSVRNGVGVGLQFGCCLYDNGWTDRMGISYWTATGTIFNLSSCFDGTCAAGCIAGWKFNSACLYSGNGKLIMNSSGAIQGNYSGDVSGWCIDAAGNAKFNNATVRGVVCACGGGNIGGFVIGTNMLCSTPAAGCSVGMSSCNTSGAVAFWAGCSTVGSAPFRVTNTGALTALCGQIGCFTLTGGCLFASVAAQDCAAVRMSQGYHCNSLGPGYGEVALDVPSTCRDRLWSTASSLIMSSWSCATAQYRCACITMCSACNGNVPASAPIMVCMLGGALCYAMCVSGSIYATGGTVCTSDRNLKTDFQDVNVLYLLRQMPITKWRFKDGKDYKIGPMAQDFNNLFRLNHDWRTNLTVSGLDGIALKAVKEVDENVQRLEKDNAAIHLKLQKLECEMAALREMIN